MSAQKQKLNVLQQVEHMKSKGIRFNIEDEKYATEYLSNNTYYFKLKAYEKLYNKSPTGENAGKYINKYVLSAYHGQSTFGGTCEPTT